MRYELILAKHHNTGEPTLYLKSENRGMSICSGKWSEVEADMYNVAWRLSIRKHVTMCELVTESGETYKPWDLPKLMKDGMERLENVRLFVESDLDYNKLHAFARVLLKHGIQMEPCPIKKSNRPTSKKQAMADWRYQGSAA